MAIDPARKIGWAACWPSEEPVFGSFATGPPGSEVGSQLLIFRRWLVGRLDEFRPAHLWYMRPIKLQHDDANRLERKFGFAAIIQVEAGDRGISCKTAEDASVVAFFTGRARYGTKEMR